MKTAPFRLAVTSLAVLGVALLRCGSGGTDETGGDGEGSGGQISGSGGKAEASGGSPDASTVADDASGASGGNSGATGGSVAGDGGTPRVNHYVDAVSGNDANDGTTPATAWKTLDKVNKATFQPNDSLLFKAGGHWTGQLKPRGSGAAGKPIILDRYGEGDKPLIDGAGVDGPAVNLLDEEYWEISNLQIINPSAVASSKRTGISVTASTLPVVHHIVLKGLLVHDVGGNIDFNTGKSSGGIQVVVGGGTSRYDDVLVEDCEVHDVTRVGITVNAGGSTAATYGTHVVVRKNTIYNTGGDGIIVRYSNAPLVENNVLHDFPMDPKASYTVGMWARSTLGAIFQFNEVWGSRTAIDGQAFDADIGADGTVFQYNYSHDNKGGFLLLMATGKNTIARYNISQNDGKALFEMSMGVPPGNKIYNNTFFLSAASDTKIILRNAGDNAGSRTDFSNNLVYNLGSGGYDVLAGLVADYNAYFGNHNANEPSDAHKTTTDPKLVDPGKGSAGMSTLGGYKPQAGSPLVNTGTSIANNGGKDFWGTALYHGLPDVGACEL